MAGPCTPQVSLLFTVVQAVGYLPPWSVWGDGPQCGFMAPRGSLPPGAVYTRELAPLGTGCVGGLVIAGPAVEAGNACELLYCVRGILCLPHSE